MATLIRQITHHQICRSQKTLELEKQKAFLEHQADRSYRKAIFFDMMIDMAEKEFNISTRKNSSPGLRAIQNRTKRNSSYTCRLLGVRGKQ